MTSPSYTYPPTQPRPPRQALVCGPSNPYDPTVRTHIWDDDIRLQAWPSRGGVIVLDEAEAIDFEFLGLNPLDPPYHRYDDQEAEDEFCQRLLLLGAKWWDSEERHFVVNSIRRGERKDDISHGDGSFRDLNRPDPTMREKRWVKVGWPSTGGLWVSEFDTTWAGVDVEEDLPPHDEGLAMVRLARTMDERCQILRDRLRGKFYEKLSDYEGYAFLRAWEWKSGGEAGPLLTPEETLEQWSESRAAR